MMLVSYYNLQTSKQIIIWESINHIMMFYNRKLSRCHKGLIMMLVSYYINFTDRNGINLVLTIIGGPLCVFQ